MRTKILSLALCVLFAMPCVLHAEEVEIQLMEVIGMSPIPGDDPLDNPEQSPGNPPCPSCFRATINGNALSVVKLESSIPSAQARVVNASTGSTIINQQFTSSLQEQIAASGIYVLHIETPNGALVGQFIVQ